MLDSITPDSIYSQIFMEEDPVRAFFLVEGPDESAVFSGHITPDVVLIVCGGKKNVIGAARIAESKGNGHVYGLVDSDFDRLRGLDSQYPSHVLATSGYDLISDLMSSSPRVLRRSLSAHAAPGVRILETEANAPIEQVVIALTSRLAAARLASIRENYPLVFKGYSFSAVIGPAYEPADFFSFLQQAPRRNPQFHIDATVLGAVEAAYCEVKDDTRFSGGHDIVGASAAVLRKAGAQISIKTISGTLISVATCDVLSSLPYLAELSTMARTSSGVDLFDCLAA